MNEGNNKTITTLLVIILAVLTLGIGTLIGHRIYTENEKGWNVRWQNGELIIEGRGGCPWDERF